MTTPTLIPARPAHLAALHDDDRMLAVRRLGELGDHAREGRRCRTGGRVFRHAQLRSKHACVIVVAGVQRRAAECIYRVADRAEPRGIGLAAADCLEVAQWHENEGIAGRPARGAERAEADVARVEAEGRGDRCIISGDAPVSLGRSGMSNSACPWTSSLASTRQRTVPMPSSSAIACLGGLWPPSRRPAGLLSRRWGWPANASSRAGVKMRRRARFAGSAAGSTNTVSGMAKLARDGLHGVAIQPSRVEHDGKRIPGKTPVGEYIEREEAAAHRFLHS